jgi:hypothetical protein
MSDLQNKSDIYMESAKILSDKSLYPPVAHCSYYACYQRIKHLWLYKMGKTEADLYSLCRTRSSEGSHEVLINEIVKYIKTSETVNNLSDSRVLNSYIGQLKKLRHRADYEDKNFDYTSCSSALSLSNDIIPILKKYQ